MSAGESIRSFRSSRSSGLLFGMRLIYGQVPHALAAARAGLDFLYLDQQHGTVTSEQIASVTAALAAIPATVLVRVAGDAAELIGSALDAGAHGVIVPDVRDGAQAARAVAAATYPPAGTRSWGRYGGEDGEDECPPLVVPMIESRSAVENVEAIATTPGVDALYVGRNDLALEAAVERGSATFDRMIAKVRSAAAAAGMPTGTSGDVEELIASGYRMLTYGSELDLIAAGIRSMRPEGGVDGTP